MERLLNERDQALEASLLARKAELIDRIERELAARTATRAELQAHLERRIEQAVAEIADVRSGFLEARADLEEIRDHRLVALESLRGFLENLRDAQMPQAFATLDRLQSAIETVQIELADTRDHRLARAEKDLHAVHDTLQSHLNELEALRDQRLRAIADDHSRLAEAVSALQTEIESVRDLRLARAEHDLGVLHTGVEGLQHLAEELREHRLPAVVDRTNALIEQLHEELTVTTGMVERLAQGEPLRIESVPAIDEQIPAAILAASQAFSDQFRGERGEISTRLSEYLPLLLRAAPVLDLGCGRGELLELLRNAGIQARGIDADPAMVGACRRIGLEVDEGDAIGTLRELPADSFGAITAIHLLEHLQAARWMELVAAAARALTPGGVLLIECPNPGSLRVGAELFWIDPTHRAPVHPEALAFVVKAIGLVVDETRLLHPFPNEQQLAEPGQPEPLRRLAERLDAFLSPPRDFMLRAQKPPR